MPSLRKSIAPRGRRGSKGRSGRWPRPPGFSQVMLESVLCSQGYRVTGSGMCSSLRHQQKSPISGGISPLILLGIRLSGLEDRPVPCCHIGSIPKTILIYRLSLLNWNYLVFKKSVWWTAVFVRKLCFIFGNERLTFLGLPSDGFSVAFARTVAASSLSVISEFCFNIILKDQSSIV